MGVLVRKGLRPMVNGQPSGTVPEDPVAVTWESLKEPPQAAPGPEVTRPRDDSAPQPVAGSPRPSAAGPLLQSSGPGQADASVTGPGPVQDTAGQGVSPRSRSREGLVIGAGTLTYSGPAVAQNGEVVFRNLPASKLSLA